MSDEIRRSEGQLWIDRQSPYGLKYHVAGETFQVETTKVYKSASENIIYAGTVVALESYSEEEGLAVKPAVFPEDVDNVLGVCAQTTVSGGELTILKSGFITLNETDISNAFYLGDSLSSEDYKANGYYKGAPVYWFIGRSYKDGSTYTYDTPESNEGKITLSTPSGIKWKTRLDNTGSQLDEDALSYNVYYSNLPIIGTLVDYKLKDDKTGFEELKISLNVSGFESDIVWTYPYKGYYTLPTGNTTLKIRHGLFPSSINASDNVGFKGFKPRCFCDILAINETDDTEQRVFAGIDNFYGQVETEGASADRRTEIEFKNVQTSKKLSITGKVVYHFHYQYI